MSDHTVLSPAQQRMYDEVRERGEVIYDGHARRTIEVLTEAGLVIAHREWDYGRAKWRYSVKTEAEVVRQRQERRREIDRAIERES